MIYIEKQFRWKLLERHSAEEEGRSLGQGFAEKTKTSNEGRRRSSLRTAEDAVTQRLDTPTLGL